MSTKINKSFVKQSLKPMEILSDKPAFKVM